MSRSPVQVRQVAQLLIIKINLMSEKIPFSEDFLRIAHKLARKGGYKTFPNPNVGCVIVKDGKIIGKGYHKFFGDSHAEINALKEAGENAKNAELYVTLEPCNHYGKTPPCTDAIIKAGIKKVYIGMKDPNPLTSGEGIKKLKQNGIQVYDSLMLDEFKKFYKDYLKRFSSQKGSYVIIKYAMTLDGKIASKTGNSKWITSKKAREWTHNLRANVDGILVGINTILKDNPTLTSHGKGKNPVRVVIDPNLRIPLESNVLNNTAPKVVIYSIEKPRKILQLKKRKVILIKLKSSNGEIHFRDILDALRKISVYKVLIEGGGETIWRAIASNLVDEIVTFISPKIVGGKKAITPVEGLGVEKINDSIKTKILEIKKIGPDILIRSKVKKKSSNR